MASGSGKDPDDHIREPVHGPGQLEDSNAAPAAAASTEPPGAAAAERGADFPSPSPPPAPPIERSQELVREQAGDGSRGTEGSSSASAGVDRKGKKVAAVPSPTDSSPTSSSSRPSVDAAASGTGTSSSAADSGKGVTWRHPVVAGTMVVPKVAMRRFECTPVVEHLEQELAAMKEADRRWTEKEEKKKKKKQQQQEEEEEQVKLPQATEALWSKLKTYSMKKISARKGSQICWGHVDEQTLPITEAINHYFGYGYTATGQGEVPGNVMNLPDAYSEFRPVDGDGECFYRSFIFSYLEQVLDRQDTNEEHRLLAAVERVNMQHAHLGWASEFSRSHKAFKKLIKKVMRWKKQGRWSSVASTNSYRKQKLLNFFSTYDTTEDIFVFLRLVAAIWICSHREEYEPRITGLREDYSLKDWCFRRVTPSRKYTDHVPMTALASALEVPLRVEQLIEGPAQDIYTGPGGPLVSVTLLFTGNHYDIIYPRPPSDESSSQQTSLGENSADESSSQQVLLGRR